MDEILTVIVMLLIYFFFIVIMSIENWIGFQSVYTRQYFIDILSLSFLPFQFLFWYVMFTHNFYTTFFRCGIAIVER